MSTITMKIYKLIILYTVIALSISCTSINPTSHQVSETSLSHLVNRNHPRATLVIGSEDLLGNIAISDPRFKSVGSLTQAQVYVQNLSEDRYTLEYKIDWEDSNGFSIQGINAWRRFTLTPHQRNTLSATGKNANATNIVVIVRLPDDAFIELYKQLEDE